MPDGAFPTSIVRTLQALLAEVSEEDVEILLLVLKQGLRRLGDEDLPAVPGRADRTPSVGPLVMRVGLSQLLQPAA